MHVGGRGAARHSGMQSERARGAVDISAATRARCLLGMKCGRPTAGQANSWATAYGWATQV